MRIASNIVVGFYIANVCVRVLCIDENRVHDI